MTERALRFGSVASAYERFRLGYPEDLVDEVLAYAGRPIRTALEIGAGTGKATRAFAGRGIAVTATDPDPAMLAELREHVPQTVVTVQASFEDLPLTPAYDLVFAAASLHWTEPSDRWMRVAAMLEQDGTFASFGGQMRLADSGVEQAVRAARSHFLSDDEVPAPDGTSADSPMQWPGTELVRSDPSPTCASRASSDARQCRLTTTSVTSRPSPPTSSCLIRYASTFWPEYSRCCPRE